MARQPWDAVAFIGKCLLPLTFVVLAGCGFGDSGTSSTSSTTGSTSTGTSSSTGTGTGTSSSTGTGTGTAATAPTSPPAINGAPVTQVQVGQAYSFTPTTSDPGNLQLGFSIQNKPSWATFNIGTGQLSGMPAAGNVGSYTNVSISVTNGQATAALPAFSIAVLPQHAVSPQQDGTATLSWAAPTKTTTGAALTDLAGYTIAYGSSGTNLNQTVSVTDPSTTTYTVQNLTAGTWYFTVAAFTSDGLKSSPSNVASLSIQ